MSEQHRRTDVRRRLIEVAADLLSEEGPSALSARRLARDAGTSTMAVYTHFGGMPALVRAVVAEGFTRLYDRVAEVEPTDDPLTDLIGAAAAYRAHALAEPAPVLRHVRLRVAGGVPADRGRARGRPGRVRPARRRWSSG